MVTKQRRNVFNPPQFQGTAVLGTEQKFTLDRTFPIEEIVLIFTLTSGVNATMTQPDGFLNVLKKVNLSVNDGVNPRSVVDFSGVGLLEYAQNAGMNLDHATLEAIRYQQAAATFTATNVARIAYRIPLVHPMIQEPLRTRMLLPCHNWDQDMILSLQFGSAAEMFSAGSINGLSVEVVVVRRQMSDALNNQIVSTGGYVPFDLVEQPFSIATGVSGEQRFTIPSPGSYANLLIRAYRGGAAVTRNTIDQTETVGNETKWQLTSGGVTEREFRFKHEQIINEWSRPRNALSLTSAPNLGSYQVTTANYFLTAGSIMLDFLGDGLNDANELGSLLDTNLPNKSGLKMELVGAVQSVATNGSTLFVGGHRFYGDLTRWQSARGI